MSANQGNPCKLEAFSFAGELEVINKEWPLANNLVALFDVQIELEFRGVGFCGRRKTRRTPAKFKPNSIRAANASASRPQTIPPSIL